MHFLPPEQSEWVEQETRSLEWQEEINFPEDCSEQFQAEKKEMFQKLPIHADAGALLIHSIVISLQPKLLMSCSDP